MNPLNPLTGLMQSRKAVMVALSMVLLTVLVALGKVSAEQFMSFLTITMPTWLAAQGFEDGMQKYNPVKPDTSVVNVAMGETSSHSDNTKPS